MFKFLNKKKSPKWNHLWVTEYWDTDTNLWIPLSATSAYSIVQSKDKMDNLQLFKGSGKERLKTRLVRYNASDLIISD